MKHIFGADLSHWAEVSSGGVYGQGEGIWTGVVNMERGGYMKSL